MMGAWARGNKQGTGQDLSLLDMNHIHTSQEVTASVGFDALRCKDIAVQELLSVAPGKGMEL